jgi:hypothetical protein
LRIFSGASTRALRTRVFRKRTQSANKGRWSPEPPHERAAINPGSATCSPYGDGRFRKSARVCIQC